MVKHLRRAMPMAATSVLELPFFSLRAPPFRRARRPLSFIDRTPLRQRRARPALWARLDLVEIAAAAWTNVVRDRPWLGLKTALSIGADQDRIGRMRRHTRSSTTCASKRVVHAKLCLIILHAILRMRGCQLVDERAGERPPDACLMRNLWRRMNAASCL